MGFWVGVCSDYIVTEYPLAIVCCDSIEGSLNLYKPVSLNDLPTNNGEKKDGYSRVILIIAETMRKSTKSFLEFLDRLVDVRWK